MARMRCPRCGTEFEVYDKQNDIRRNANNKTKFENKKENEKMMNKMDMEMLAKMVAEQIKNETNEAGTTQTEVDGGQWAKTSKFYGKEICGYAYNPYLVRRFLPRQFMDMMENFNLNVNEGIRCEYGYMKGIIYLIDECEKLAMLYKRDKIAYDERSKFWSVSDCKKAFIQYADDCLKELERIKEGCTLKTTYVKMPKYGRIPVTVTEAIENHNVVLKVKLDSSIEVELDMLKDKLIRCCSYKEIANVMRAFKLMYLEGTRKIKLVYNYTTKSLDKKYTNNYRGYELPKEFVKGFKKSGAYYTLKNLIMFEGYELKDLKEREAVSYLRRLLNNGTEDYVFYAILKEVLDK